MKYLIAIIAMLLTVSIAGAVCGNWGWGDIPPPAAASDTEIESYIQDQLDYYEQHGCHDCGTPDTAFEGVYHWTTCSHLPTELQSDWPDIPFNADAAWIGRNTDYWN